MSQHALRLVHGELHSEQRLVIEIRQIEYTFFGIEAFTHIARKIHCRIVLDGSHGDLADAVDRKIHVNPVLSVIDMAVIIDFIHLSILT